MTNNFPPTGNSNSYGYYDENFTASPPAGDVVEIAAKTIYDTWSATPGYVPWIAGGNSDRQIDARRIAKRVIDAAMEAHSAILARAKIELSSMSARLAETERNYRDAAAAHDLAMRQIDKLAARNAALDRYVRHDGLCGIVGGYGYCTCGLDVAKGDK